MKKVIKGYPDEFHIPVLYKEVLETLMINPDGIYYDGTLGGGGHAEKFLQSLSNRAIYIGVDRDPEAVVVAGKRLAEYKNLIIYNGTFNMFEAALAKANWMQYYLILVYPPIRLMKTDGVLLFGQVFHWICA